MPEIWQERVIENRLLPVRYEMIRSENRIFPAHWHQYLEVLCLYHGKMSAINQGVSYHLAPGDIFIVNPGDIHMTVTYGYTLYHLLQVPEGMLRRIIPDLDQLRFRTLIRAETRQDNMNMLSLLQEMQKITEEKEDGYPFLFQSRLYEFLYLIYRCGVDRKDTSDNHTFSEIGKVLPWIQEHYNESLTLEKAAARAGFSKEYFCRLFKKYTGQTFLDYLNSVRAAKLYEDLGSMDISITNLLEKHGIRNYKVFLKKFRTMYGTTPRAVRIQLLRAR